MRRLTLPLTLGLAHGAADGAAGLLLGSLPRSLALEQVALLVLLYNLLAFGGQPLFGLLVDRVGRPRAAALAGLALLCAALLIGRAQQGLAVTLAGLGSAAFHVGGGALALCATRGRASGPGLFAAPGVVGLAAGGALAVAGFTEVWPFLLPLLALVGAIAALDLPALTYDTTNDQGPTINAGPRDEGQRSKKHPEGARPKNQQRTTDNGQRPTANQQSAICNLRSEMFEGHDLVMLALLAGIALRSAVWSSLQFLFEGRYDLLMIMALAAAVGKILGGPLADRVGWRRWIVAALALAAPLLTLGGQRLVPLLLGVALLQSATPAALAATARLLPRQPATAAGLALGLAIAIGGIPSLSGIGALMSTPAILTGLLVAAALALWWALRQPRLRYTQ